MRANWKAALLVGLLGVLAWRVLAWRTDMVNTRRATRESERLARYYQSGRAEAEVSAWEEVRDTTMPVMRNPGESDSAWVARHIEEGLRADSLFTTDPAVQQSKRAHHVLDLLGWQQGYPVLYIRGGMICRTLDEYRALATSHIPYERLQEWARHHGCLDWGTQRVQVSDATPDGMIVQVRFWKPRKDGGHL